MSVRGNFLKVGLDILGGDLSVLNGNLTLKSGDLILTNGDITQTSGGLTLTLGDLTLTAGDIINTLGDLTLVAGDFLITLGDATLTDGNLLLTSGNLTLTSGNLVLSTAEYIKGNQFTVTMHEIDSAALDLGEVFWTAPAPCELVALITTHGVVAGQACTAQIERLTSAEVKGGNNGDALLTSGIDLETTANTPVGSTIVSDGSEIISSAHRIGITKATGTSTSLVDFSVTLTLKWR